MGFERRKNKKEKKSVLKRISGDAILAAGALGALAAAGAVHDHKHIDDLPLAWTLGDSHKEYDTFRKKHISGDRRTPESAKKEKPMPELTIPRVIKEFEKDTKLENSKLAKDLGINQIKMPRDKHSVNTWNKKNQIDHAIKKVQRSVLDIRESTDSEEKSR